MSGDDSGSKLFSDDEFLETVGAVSMHYYITLQSLLSSFCSLSKLRIYLVRICINYEWLSRRISKPLTLLYLRHTRIAHVVAVHISHIRLIRALSTLHC